MYAACYPWNKTLEERTTVCIYIHDTNLWICFHFQRTEPLTELLGSLIHSVPSWDTNPINVTKDIKEGRRHVHSLCKIYFPISIWSLAFIFENAINCLFHQNVMRLAKLEKDEARKYWFNPLSTTTAILPRDVVQPMWSKSFYCFCLLLQLIGVACTNNIYYSVSDGCFVHMDAALRATKYIRRR